MGYSRWLSHQASWVSLNKSLSFSGHGASTSASEGVAIAHSSGPSTEASEAHWVTLTHHPAPTLQEVLSEGILRGQLRS